MHIKNFHWHNRFRCLLQLCPIILTNSLIIESALANTPNLLPVPQLEPITAPKPLTHLPQVPQPSLLPTPTLEEVVPTSAFSPNSAISDQLDAKKTEKQPTFNNSLPFPTPEQSPSPQNTPKATVCSKTTSAPESGTTLDAFTVEEFFFVINHPVFTPAELKSFTKGYLNKVLSPEQLMQVAAEITKQYAARGYSTSSAVVCLSSQTKQQEKTAAIIRVIEGELERIDVKSSPANQEYTEGSRVRLNPNYVRSRLALAASKPLNVNKLQAALQLLQQDPLIESANFRLLSGSSPGKSILEVEVKQAKSFSVSLSNDISGFSHLGISQQQIVLTEANLLGIGDSLSLGYSGTEGTHNWNVNYTFPLNARNGTLSFTYNQSQAEGISALNGFVPSSVQSINEETLAASSINSPLDSLQVPGNSSNQESTLRTYELTLRQPIIRRIAEETLGNGEQPPSYEELALGLTAFLGESPTISSLLPLSLSSLSNDSGMTRTFALRFFQEFKKHNAQDSIELRSQFSFGFNSLSSTSNEPLALGNSVPATFVSWQGQAQWTRILAKDTLLLVRANAQLAYQTLVPSEQFILGGKGGYLQDSLLTDNGIFASTEVQLPVMAVFRGKGLIQVIPFVDFGTGWNNSGQTNPSPNTMASVGLGLQWQQDRVTARLDWGIPLISVNSPYGTGLENALYFSVQYNP
ncbi:MULTISPECIES: ShlB/FhaC/HecB family hemolysin secretion/activation protein [unclassified Tolypothrix]|uniref:ShlB/FhaC/HecB family hemolysin secretion/activation protein n=1 Tax=unclassified Tolypothrix TaxID=2649714 RepID=UPI0005EAAFD0|nr:MULTISPECIES: ShlB/FhaC/HecB family hemolysin secretion/activation protein [unclassified Tolypothrix]BAY90745.1 surface antigen D15 domain-containing protein [Microchaete diplosiphon NIES-3275]EKF04422.1 outer membrane protein, OMP85 family [Tolypothrix sp. PCC 7601]MBE9081053.1 BamA/TamA family outer membrane protein [Tolypothrix sp. LEGE 11397]UYD24882.1 BamA/TamA family outer membrane protein [Tolypothrix sp. PCC 7712]UYD32886.1 BamA/TamA family outer membrane protein [Tolypothrix sp. PC